MRPEGPSTGKRALTNSRPFTGVAAEERSWCSVARAPMRARARSGDRVQPQPNAPTSIRAPPVGICKQTEARARPTNVRTSRAAAPFQRRSVARRLRAAKHLEIRGNPGWRLEGACLTGRRTIQSACAYPRRGQLAPAERSLVVTRFRVGVWLNVHTHRATEARFEPSRANEAILHEP